MLVVTLLLAPPLLLDFLAGELVVQVVVQHRQEAAGTTPAPIFLHHLENLRPRGRQIDRDSETERGCGKGEKARVGRARGAERGASWERRRRLLEV